MKNTFDCPLRLGQRVRHTDFKGQRVTGVIHGLSVCPDRGLMVDCRLDAPLVIPADEHGPEIKIWTQYAQAQEFTPFDERDELLATMRDALQAVVRQCGPKLAEVSGNEALLPHLEAVIGQAAGSAS